MARMPQPFGNHTTYSNHSGVDYPEAQGTIIRASGPGYVTWNSWFSSKAGYGTCIRYDSGCEVLYAHQIENGNRPPINSRVDEGTHIGIVGSTGNSTGPHLHMEIQSGQGAHTYNGIWNYFDPELVVGQVPVDEEEREIVFIANVKGSWYLIVPQGGEGKPQAVVLGADANAANSGIPVVNFNWDESIKQLQKAVNGI